MLSKKKSTKESPVISQVKGNLSSKQTGVMLTKVDLTEDRPQEATASLKNQMRETAGDVSVPHIKTQVQMGLTSAGSTLQV